MPNNLDNIELRSEEVQEVLNKVPHWMIRRGSQLFLVLIMLFLFITWFIKYPDIITGVATLTTNTPPQKEYAKLSGKITHILVNNDDKISTHTPLAILENTANYKDVFFLKKIIDTIKVNNHNFSFPLDKIPMLFLGDIETHFALFENNYIQYKLNKDLNPYQYQAKKNKTTSSELSHRLMTLEAQKDIYTSEISFKKKDLKRYELLFNKGVVSAQEYENKQLDFLQTQRNYKNITASISQAREQISSSSNNIKENSINHTRDEIKLLKNVIQSFNQLKKSIQNWELQYTFMSKIEGNVSFMNYWSENQTVNTGDLVFTVIPKNHNGYIIKAKVPSLNSGKLKIGQQANIKLQNYPEAEFGMLLGKVKSISNIPDSQGNYFVDIALQNKLTTTYGDIIDFKQEMIGTVDIITEDLRLIERFFYQFRGTMKRK